MDLETQLKVQAYLDGELPEAESREIGNLVARDREALALHTELRNTRTALVGSEIGVELPESREFFWSKIQREIQRLEPSEPAPVPVPWFVRLRRLLAPAAGTLIARGYGRTEEYEADRHGIDILRRAGYSKDVMVDALVWIRGISGDNGGGFLSTHPALDDRIAALQKTP
jgi:hypothetical protein